MEAEVEVMVSTLIGVRFYPHRTRVPVTTSWKLFLVKTLNLSKQLAPPGSWEVQAVLPLPDRCNQNPETPCCRRAQEP